MGGHHHLHGLGFLKACSGFKISYESCLKLNPMGGDFTKNQCKLMK
jgi:hypothetical protein